MQQTRSAITAEEHEQSKHAHVLQGNLQLLRTQVVEWMVHFLSKALPQLDDPLWSYGPQV